MSRSFITESEYAGNINIWTGTAESTSHPTSSPIIISSLSMLNFATSLLAFSTSLLLAGASPLDARAAESMKCTTTYTGYFEAGPGNFGLSTSNYVVFPAAAHAPEFEVSFQVCISSLLSHARQILMCNVDIAIQRCPQLTSYGTAEDYAYWGRMVAVESSTVAANQCLTSTPSSTTGIINLELAPCGSEYVPPANQSWAYMDDDFGKEMLFVSAPASFLVVFVTDAYVSCRRANVLTNQATSSTRTRRPVRR